MRRSLALAVLFAAACSTAPPVAERPAPTQGKGGYYKDDGPGSAPPPNLGQIPDAEPKTEPLHRYANKPYKVFGTEYVPIADARGFKQRGVASWYGRRFHGQKTASGERGANAKRVGIANFIFRNHAANLFAAESAAIKNRFAFLPVRALCARLNWTGQKKITALICKTR